VLGNRAFIHPKSYFLILLTCRSKLLHAVFGSGAALACRDQVNKTTISEGSMKKLSVCLLACGMAGLFTGCVGPMGQIGGIGGSIYTDVSGAIGATGNAVSTKSGSSTSTGILGIATGDSSINAAAANGGITKIHHVDYHTMTILGVYGKTTVTVYGE
jgi:hypothetical protein